MDAVITNEELLTYFRKEMQRRERNAAGGYGGGMCPHAPILILFLGEDVQHISHDLRERLDVLWSELSSEIQYLKLDVDGSCRGCTEGNNGAGEVMSPDELSGVINHLFSADIHVRTHDHINIYYVLNTTEFVSGGELERWAETIRGFHNSLPPIRRRAMLMLTLNEDYTGKHRDVSRKARNILSTYDNGTIQTESGPCDTGLDCVLLLSNFRKDNSLVPFDTICRIMASVIAVTDCEHRLSIQTYDNGVYTAGYAEEEKPHDAIGSTVICEIASQFADFTKLKDVSVRDPETKRRLGISNANTLCVLDEEAGEIERDMPDLTLFPRNSNQDINVQELTVQEFNELTMDTWKQYPRLVVQDNIGGIGTDKLKEKFTNELWQNFSIGELADMKGSTDAIRDLIRPQGPSDDDPVGEAIQSMLRYELSSSPELIQPLLDAVQEVGKTAEEVSDFWYHLSRRNIAFDAPEPTLRRFYKNKCESYFAGNGEKLKKRINQIRTLRGHIDFLKEVISYVVESDTVFDMPFDKELETRMAVTGENVAQYVKQKLGTGVVVYLNVGLDLPCFSAVLMDTRADVRRVLSGIMHDAETGIATDGTENYFYYNTGDNSAAATLKLYKIDRFHLMSGEDM